MSETVQTLLAVAVLIAGPFFLLWMLDRRRQAKRGQQEQAKVEQRRQAKGEQPAVSGGRRLLGMLGILVVGTIVLVGVIFACIWVVVAQPTVGKIRLDTVAAIGVVVGFSLLIIIGYVAGIVSDLSRIGRKR